MEWNWLADVGKVLGGSLLTLVVQHLREARKERAAAKAADGDRARVLASTKASDDERAKLMAFARWLSIALPCTAPPG